MSDIQQRLDLHGRILVELIRFCGLQNTMISLIAGQLKQLDVPAPPGVGVVALTTATAYRDVLALITQEIEYLPADTQKAITETLGGDQWLKSR